MKHPLLNALASSIATWRDSKYAGILPESQNILRHIKKVGFLHQPQLEALETYIYLKEVLGNKPTYQAMRSLFPSDRELILALGLSQDEALELAFDPEKDSKINKKLYEQFGELDYPNQIFALTMGSGKTILMGTMILYDFVLSYYHPDDNRFAKNVLVFAPDTTIIESLKEIKNFEYSLVLPKEYLPISLNIKYHYLESPDTALNPIGNYNIVVSNSQKIILKSQHVENRQLNWLKDDTFMKYQARENKRLLVIREMKNLAVFVDEAHHSFGKTLEGALKKTRQTIEYIHKEGKTPLINAVNLTGTPYVNGKMMPDVVYHFGLKQGIEMGILKQVRFFEYGNVQSEEFVVDVLEKFWSEYGENRLEDKLPKIAFYAPSIDVLRQELMPQISKFLSQKGISTDKILEFHTEAESQKEEFLKLDTAESEKQIVLLVGKGTEGWNCRSLVSCALFRKPKSAIFVLQSATRCLRSIGDNSVRASVFVSPENAKILDKELRNNFATSLEDLQNQEQKVAPCTLTVEKKCSVQVKKLLKTIEQAVAREPEGIKIDWKNYQSDQFEPFVRTSGISLEGRQAKYETDGTIQTLTVKNSLTAYEIIDQVSRETHLSGVTVKKILTNNSASLPKLVAQINNSPGMLFFIIQSILKQVYEYTENTEIVDEVLELTKNYPFKINVREDKRSLIVYKEAETTNRLGFHINPYNFDSRDEKELFAYLRKQLRDNEVIRDVYFTGGVTDSSHNDFFFEYYSPEKKRVARYFPDLLIETSQNRYIVIEVKTTQEKLAYEKNKSLYSGKLDDLFSEVYAKEVGFNDFQKVNQNFEYHIIFDAGLQRQQEQLFADISSQIS